MIASISEFDNKLLDPGFRRYAAPAVSVGEVALGGAAP